MWVHCVWLITFGHVWLEMSQERFTVFVYFNKKNRFLKVSFWLQTQNPVGKSCRAQFRVSQKVTLNSEWSEAKCCLPTTSKTSELTCLSLSSSVLHCSLKLPGLWPTLHQGRLRRHRQWSNPVRCLDRLPSTGSACFDFICSVCSWSVYVLLSCSLSLSV